MRTPFGQSHLVLAVLLAWVASLVGLSASAAAQDVDTGQVKVRAVADQAAVAPGGSVLIAVDFSYPNGFHSWPNPECSVEKKFDEGNTRTSVELDAAARSLNISKVLWPAPTTGFVLDPDGGDAPVKAPVFARRVTAYFVVDVAKDAVTGSATVPLAVRYQTCNESTCFQPNDFTLSVPIIIADATAVAAAPHNDAPLFAGFDATKAVSPVSKDHPVVGEPPVRGSLPLPGPTPGSTQPSVPTAEAPRTIFGFGVGSSLILIALAAMLGGAILNLTPCVLPIIPIKVMSLVEHSGSPHRRIVLGIWMALGVVAFWIAVGLPMAFIRTLNPNQLLFGHWWVTLILGLVIALMGLGIMGLFSINLPQSVYMINPKADSARGSFFFGIMTGVLGLPCFGFVAGGLLAGSTALSSLTIMVIFAGLGIGMAAPYLVLTAKPGLIAKIPRTGPASELVKQVLGLFILAAAAFFTSVALRTALIEMPYLSESIAYWAVAFFVFLAGFWLTLRVLAISKKPWPKLVMPVVALFLVAAATGYAARSTSDDRKDYERHVAGDTAWEPFSQEILDQGLNEGKVVVIDFTASWCLTCKALKRGVLDKEPLYSVLHADNVRILEGDLTSSSDPSWAKYRALGQAAPPGLVIYGPASSDPIILNAYTQQVVIDAINRVRGATTATAK